MIYKRPRLSQKIISSPLGEVTLVASDDALTHVYVHKRHDSSETYNAADKHPILELAAQELDLYFRGAVKIFATPLAFDGTHFQQAVWRALVDIPWGMCVSYSDIAKEIGSPRAMRAVGSANAKNHLPLFIPCHRVIASNGNISDYALGVSTKRWLLEHEGSFIHGVC